MTVPFLDISAATNELKAEIDAAVTRVIESGWYILGPEVEAFEAEFARYVEAEHALGVGNGLDALVLSLHALDIGPGDEVLVPSNTFIATWLAVSAVGATPVPVAPNIATYNIDPEKVKAAVTPKTRGIIIVHLYGQPADLDPLIDGSRDAGLAVIEDAAQAHGARYKGKRIGAHGDVVCWSFYPGKNLGALGDGGAVSTNNADIADRIAVLRNYGSKAKYIHETKGMNSRLDPIQAAVLRVKLAHLDTWNARRRSVATQYTEALAGTDLKLPHVPNWAEPVWHLFVVEIGDRDALQIRLGDAGIQTLIHYPVPPELQGAYWDDPTTRPVCDIAERMARRVLSLPMGPHLTSEDQKKVISALTCIN